MAQSKDRKGLQLGRGIRAIYNTKTGRVGFRVQMMINGRRAQHMVETHDQALALRNQWRKEGFGGCPPRYTDDHLWVLQARAWICMRCGTEHEMQQTNTTKEAR